MQVLNKQMKNSPANFASSKQQASNVRYSLRPTTANINQNTSILSKRNTYTNIKQDTAQDNIVQNPQVNNNNESNITPKQIINKSKTPLRNRNDQKKPSVLLTKQKQLQNNNKKTPVRQQNKKDSIIFQTPQKPQKESLNKTNEHDSDRLSTCESMNNEQGKQLPYVTPQKSLNSIKKYSNDSSTTNKNNLSDIPNNKKKLTLVLDMDETLIHAYNIMEKEVRFYTRPYCLELLKNMSEYYEIIVFTAAAQQYADSILDILDIENCISKRLYRQDLGNFKGSQVKDLTVLNIPMEQIIIVDNLRENFDKQSENGYEIPNFYGNTDDIELFKLEILLRQIAKNYQESEQYDVRDGLKDKQQIFTNNRQIISLFQSQLLKMKKKPTVTSSFLSTQPTQSINTTPLKRNLRFSYTQSKITTLDTLPSQIFKTEVSDPLNDTAFESFYKNSLNKTNNEIYEKQYFYNNKYNNLSKRNSQPKTLLRSNTDNFEHLETKTNKNFSKCRFTSYFENNKSTNQ